MATYLVTGGAGFIGSHIVAELVARGEKVRVVDSFITGKRENLASLLDRIELVEMDLVSDPRLPSLMEGVDYVLHQAAVPSVPRSVADPLLVHETCATVTLKVLIAARDAHVKRFVYAASSAAYGNLPGDYKIETMATDPLSPYAVAKLSGEQYCQVFHQVYGLETVALRYFNVFGPRQDPASPYSAVIPLFAAAMLDDQAPTIFGDGLQSRDFTYVANIVHGNLLACAADGAQVGGQVINLACGVSISLLDLVHALNELLGTQITPHFAAARAGDVKFSSANIDKARRLLGYAPVVDLEEGLRHTLEWLKASA